MTGHGGDILCAEWHPCMSMIASGSKDTLVKLWDPRAGRSLSADLRGHNQTVTSCSWNANGNWLLTTSRDTLCKVRHSRSSCQLEHCQFPGTATATGSPPPQSGAPSSVLLLDSQSMLLPLALLNEVCCCSPKTATALGCRPPPVVPSARWCIPPCPGPLPC